MSDSYSPPLQTPWLAHYSPAVGARVERVPRRLRPTIFRLVPRPGAAPIPGRLLAVPAGNPH